MFAKYIASNANVKKSIIQFPKFNIDLRISDIVTCIPQTPARASQRKKTRFFR